MALTGYFDDSGTDAENPALIVAGFLSDVDQWDRLGDEMEQLRAEPQYNAPPFHAKGFDDGRRGHGPYAGWGEKKRREYMARLLGIIIRRCIKSFGTVLEKSAYNSIIAPDPAHKDYFGTLYAFAAVNCIHAACEWRNKSRPGEPILFIFDKGNKNQGQLEDIGKRYLVGSDKLIENVTSGDDEKIPPLQVADLLAFELCSEARNALNPKNKFSRFPLLQLAEHPNEWLRAGDKRITERIQKLQAAGGINETPPPSLPPILT
ncbi:hypothetical protein SBA6_490014 [Candidatus Sulfopaludibacter sp. SbA6]|nr:hypothetical protein SBA6_490014 [Candidatus Sulfopaludibacter sp. SbA6]